MTRHSEAANQRIYALKCGREIKPFGVVTFIDGWIKIHHTPSPPPTPLFSFPFSFFFHNHKPKLQCAQVSPVMAKKRFFSLSLSLLSSFRHSLAHSIVPFCVRSLIENRFFFLIQATTMHPATVSVSWLNPFHERLLTLTQEKKRNKELFLAKSS